MSGRRPSTSLSLGQAGIVALLALLALAFPLLRPRLAPRPEQLLARCAMAPAPEARASCYREELRRIAYRRAATPGEIGWLCLKVGDPECAKGFGAIARAYAWSSRRSIWTTTRAAEPSPPWTPPLAGQAHPTSRSTEPIGLGGRSSESGAPLGALPGPGPSGLLFARWIGLGWRLSEDV